MYRRICVLVVLLLAPSAAAAADTLYLRNGDRLTGRLSRIEDGKVTLKTDYAGELTVLQSHLRTLTTSGTATVELDAAEYLTGTVRGLEGDSLAILDGEGERLVTLGTHRLRALYRRDPAAIERERLAPKADGHLNLGLEVQRGNTNRESLHFDGRIRVRTPGSRYTLQVEYDREEDEGIETDRSARGSLQYDYFLTSKAFWFTGTTFEHDPFEDVELRSTLTTGLGYQFYESERRTLSAEAGVTYIDENFRLAPDRASTGGKYALDYQETLREGYELFHHQEGLSSSDVEFLHRSRSGLRVALAEGLQGTVQFNLDWDADPVPGASSTDTRYLITLGYVF